MKIVWTQKGIRIVLGIIMMTGFLNLVFTVYFFLQVMARMDSLLGMAVLVFGYNFLYVPCLLLIVLCYLLLTRVFKYEP